MWRCSSAFGIRRRKASGTLPLLVTETLRLALRAPVREPRRLLHRVHAFPYGHERRRRDVLDVPRRRDRHRQGRRGRRVRGLEDGDDVLLAEAEVEGLQLASGLLYQRTVDL